MLLMQGSGQLSPRTRIRVAAPSICFAVAHILLAAAPTTVPCFRHWRRSPLLQSIPSPALLPCGQQGPTPADGPQRNYPLSCRNRCSLPVRPHPVKMRLERPCGYAAMKAPVGLSSRRAVCDSRWKGFALTSVEAATNANIKIIFPLNMPRATRRAF